MKVSLKSSILNMKETSLDRLGVAMAPSGIQSVLTFRELEAISV